MLVINIVSALIRRCYVFWVLHQNFLNFHLKNHWKLSMQKKQSPEVLEISQNTQENTCARVSFLIKLQAEACNVIKKDSGTGVFL